jgi:hypothetical protein
MDSMMLKLLLPPNTLQQHKNAITYSGGITS